MLEEEITRVPAFCYALTGCWEGVGASCGVSVVERRRCSIHHRSNSHRSNDLSESRHLEAQDHLQIKREKVWVNSKHLPMSRNHTNAHTHTHTRLGLVLITQVLWVDCLGIEACLHSLYINGAQLLSKYRRNGYHLLYTRLCFVPCRGLFLFLGQV